LTIQISKKQLQELFNVLRFDKRSGKWKNIAKAARKIGISRPTVYKILERYPQGMPEKPKVIKPQFVEKYEDTIIHKKIFQAYTDKVTGKLSRQGMKVDNVGLKLFLAFNQTDPATLEVDHFRKAWEDPRFLDPNTGQISFNNASAMRIIMSLSGIDPKRYREFTTKGLKRRPSKKGWYLEESELIRFIYGIEDTETLVFSRIGYEGGGRFSSTIKISTENISYDMSMIEMQEPKVKQTKERYFVPCTMQFIRQYIRDHNIVGRLFKKDYNEFLKSLRKAGLNAGLWRYTGKFAEKKVFRRGKERILKRPIVEGKLTTSHLLKHTFVSLSSLHGFGLDDVSEQTGTDPDTLRKFYLGVGKKKLKGVILGEIEYVAWHTWILKEIHPHWQKRYEQLRAGKG